MKMFKIFSALLILAITVIFGSIMLEKAIIGDILYNNSISMTAYQDAPAGSYASEAFNSAKSEYNRLKAVKEEKADGAIPGWFSSLQDGTQFLVFIVAIIASIFSLAYLHGRWVIFTRTLKKAAATTRRA